LSPITVGTSSGLPLLSKHPAHASATANIVIHLFMTGDYTIIRIFRQDEASAPDTADTGERLAIHTATTVRVRVSRRCADMRSTGMFDRRCTALLYADICGR